MVSGDLRPPKQKQQKELCVDTAAATHGNKEGQPLVQEQVTCQIVLSASAAGASHNFHVIARRDLSKYQIAFIHPKMGRMAPGFKIHKC